jgi:glycosyltransferase involved in cell wall biosynthesis
MPVYNGERYLRPSLDALLSQTFADFELVIGDNGSTDATRDISQEAATQDARVRYLPSDENRGAAWNYNRVFHATSGHYFRWAAHDDLVAPTHLERLVETLDDTSPATVLAQSLTTFIDEHGNEIGPWDDGFDLSSDRASNRLGQLVRHLLKSNVLFGLVRRSALERTRLHGAYPSADYVLLAELALVGRFAVVPERLFFRRVHPGMSRIGHKSLAEVAEWFEPGTGEEARPEFLRLFAEHVRAIVRSPLDTRERARAFRVFLPIWFARHKRAMADELWGQIGGRLRPREG